MAMLFGLFIATPGSFLLIIAFGKFFTRWIEPAWDRWMDRRL